jgi:hypothetical protein
MGKRQDGRIEPGQKLSGAISARAWNRAQDAADIVLAERTGFGAGGQSLSELARNIVLVRNDSGQDVPWLGVLGLGAPVISPVGGTLGGTDSASSLAREFVSKPALSGGTPSLVTYSSFAVAMEPIRSGAIGRAAVGGVFACRVDVVASWHGFANMRNGDSTQLQSTDCGPLKLIWKEDGTGQNKWVMGVM